MFSLLELRIKCFVYKHPQNTPFKEISESLKLRSIPKRCMKRLGIIRKTENTSTERKKSKYVEEDTKILKF